jgi:DNA transposition AAA+ family ATPase
MTMPLPIEEQAFLEGIKQPPHAKCVEIGDKFLGLTGMSVFDLAEGIRRDFGRCGRSTLLLWFRSRYGAGGTGSNGVHDAVWLDKRVWDFVQRHMPKMPETPEPPEVLKTESYRKFKLVFEDGLESGAGAVVYAPASGEKSELAQHFVYSRRAAGFDDAVYLYCGNEMATPFALLRALARALGVYISRANLSQTYVDAILENLRRRECLPVICFDEAQRLELRTLETIIGLHDRTRRGRRRGFGFIWVGSHKLSQFLHARSPEIEQILSRIPHRVHLVGMSDKEALELAARAWGNGKPAQLSSQKQELVLARSRVLDNYAPICGKCSADWDATRHACVNGCAAASPKPHPYFSSRRLLEYLRQHRNANLRTVMAKESL